MNLKMEQKLLDSFSLSSLTDIVLLLLVFFLLSSTFIIQPGIKVSLPEAETSDEVLDKSITVTIAKEGLYYLNDKQVSLNELGANLNSMFKTNSDEVIVLKADKDVTVNQLVEVWDICKKVGFSVFNLATEPVNG